jgi:hypothetical protein
MNEALLGFDIRELWIEPDRLWDQPRRNTFLLQPAVQKPLSVDPLVWTSFFDTGQGLGLPASERQRLRLAGRRTPAWIGPSGLLWSDLSSMMVFYSAERDRIQKHVVLAVGWVSDAEFSDAGAFGPHRSPTQPAVRDPGWRRLGYDVADGSLLSGLMNCALREEEQTRRGGHRWGAQLNAAHLFDDILAAFAFRDASNALVAEHAPFFVYGLYVVQEVGLPGPASGNPG